MLALGRRWHTLDVLLKMDTGNIVPLCFATPLLVCLVVTEIRWRKRLRDWKPSEGRMLRVDWTPDSDAGHPVIGYNFSGEMREQVCDFNLRTPMIGEEVPIIIHPETGKIFLTTLRDRWTLTTILTFSIVALIALSVLSN